MCSEDLYNEQMDGDTVTIAPSDGMAITFRDTDKHQPGTGKQKQVVAQDIQFPIAYMSKRKRDLCQRSEYQKQAGIVCRF